MSSLPVQNWVMVILNLKRSFGKQLGPFLWNSKKNREAGDEESQMLDIGLC